MSKALSNENVGSRITEILVSRVDPRGNYGQ